MKNWLGLLVIALTLGLALIGCNANKLEGTTWEQSDGSDDGVIVFGAPPNVTFADGPNKEKGTYTVSGKKVTITVDDESITGTISGNVLTFYFDGEPRSTFTKTGNAESSAKKNSKDSGKAAAVVKQYYAALAKGDAKTIGKVMTAKGAQNLTPFMAKAKDHVAALGKITKIEEDIDGDSGVVNVTFSNGATEEIDVMKVNGKWKISEWDKGLY
jgi:hypothetical protein